jgi:hypothetical protein
MMTLGRGTFRPVASATFELARIEASLAALIGGYTGRDLTFEVTPKGRSKETRVPVPRVLLVFALVHVAAVAWYVVSVLGVGGVTYAVPGIAHGAAFWALVNLALLARAIGRVRRPQFRPERRSGHRFRLDAGGSVAGRIATIVDISTTGARARVWATDVPLKGGEVVEVTVDRAPRGTADLQAQVVAFSQPDDGPATVQLEFLEGQVEDRALATADLFTGAVPSGADETRPFLRLVS